MPTSNYDPFDLIEADFIAPAATTRAGRAGELIGTSWFMGSEHPKKLGEDRTHGGHQSCGSPKTRSFGDVVAQALKVQFQKTTPWSRSLRFDFDLRDVSVYL
jgi:hypothetical protein